MTATTTERTARRPEQRRADQPPARGTRRRLRTPAKGAAGPLRLAGLALGLALALGGSTQAHGGATGTVARCEIAVNRGVDALVAADGTTPSSRRVPGWHGGWGLPPCRTEPSPPCSRSSAP